jgi:isopentenyl-diphosphate Delta-isomerase
MNRKDDHIQFALQQTPQTNDFDRIRFVHHAIGTLNHNDIDLSVHLFNHLFPYPLYINAMTGGSEQAKTINHRLALLAREFSLPMATGSLSAALKDPSQAASFTTIMDAYPDGFRIANVGADKDYSQAQQAIDLIDAQALQIHLNLTQELIMPEGDRNFKNWKQHLQSIQENTHIPLIIKEVGFGMSFETMVELKAMGFQIIDVSGKGGTNFAQIENQRRPEKLAYLNEWGLSTVESLLETQRLTDIQVLASGGIRHPLDVIKALALGAKMVGLSSYFLHLVTHHSHDVAVDKLRNFLEELKTLMVLLHASTIQDLRNTQIIYDQQLIHFIHQRQHSQ